MLTLTTFSIHKFPGNYDGKHNFNAISQKIIVVFNPGKIYGSTKSSLTGFYQKRESCIRVRFAFCMERLLFFQISRIPWQPTVGHFLEMVDCYLVVVAVSAVAQVTWGNYLSAQIFNSCSSLNICDRRNLKVPACSLTSQQNLQLNGYWNF